MGMVTPTWVVVLAPAASGPIVVGAVTGQAALAVMVKVSAISLVLVMFSVYVTVSPGTPWLLACAGETSTPKEGCV